MIEMKVDHIQRMVNYAVERIQAAVAEAEKQGCSISWTADASTGHIYKGEVVQKNRTSITEQDIWSRAGC